MKFEIGDKVIILKKSVYSHINRTSLNIGDIVTIESISNNVYCVKPYCGMLHCYLAFHESDLEIADYQELLNRRYKKHVIRKKII